MENEGKLVVAIQSTMDYVDKNFHQELVDTNIQNPDGSWGTMIDMYRLVFLNKDGRIQPLEPLSYDCPEDAKNTIRRSENLVLGSYEEMLKEATRRLQERQALAKTQQQTIAFKQESSPRKTFDDYLDR